MTVVSLNRNDVGFIVTEHEVARLKRRNIRERVDSLIAIAHSRFLQELRSQAQKLMLW